MSDNKSPLVSVVMATFNEPAEYVTLAIQSILNQSYTNIELLIADDSINSETIDAIDKFSGNEKVRILREPARLGFVPSLNKCIRLAKGEFIARMDGDDISFPNRIAMQVDKLTQDDSISVLGGNTKLFIGDKDNIIGEKKYPQKGVALRLRTIFRCPLAHPTVMFRRRVFDDGFFYNENYKKAEDLYLWLKLLKKHYRIENLNEYVLYFRRSEDFMKRRTGSHLKYNLKARLECFDWLHPLFSIFSCFNALILFVIPKSLYALIYNRFDKKKRD